MKIAFAHDHIFKIDDKKNVYSNGGLGQNVLKRYLLHFEEVEILARGEVIKSNEKLTPATIEGVNFNFIPSLSKIKNKILERNNIKKRIKDILVKSDGLIARLPSEIGNLAIECAIEINLPWAVEVVGCAYDAYFNYGTFKGKVYAPIMEAKTKKYVKKSKCTIFVTESYLQKKYPGVHFRVSASDVIIKDCNLEILEKRMKGIKASSLEKIKIGVIASLNSKYKGIDILMKALKQIQVEYELSIVGGGDISKWQRYANELGIGEKIDFKGYLQAGEDINRWLDNINLYIQPSLTEGLARATIEAISRGCPTIVSDVGGLPELVKSEYVVKVGDYNELANKISHITSSKKTMLEMSKQNFEKSQNYTFEKLENEREKFFVELKNLISVSQKSI